MKKYCHSNCQSTKIKLKQKKVSVTKTIALYKKIYGNDVHNKTMKKDVKKSIYMKQS